MADVRKILVIFLIGILYAIFVTSLIEAVHPSPRYEDYCVSKPGPATPVKTEIVNCSLINPVQCESGGMIQYEYDSNGCPKSAYCDYCNNNLQEAQKKYNLTVFIISSVMAIIAIAIGLLLPTKKKSINEWIGTGFLLGGLITLFVGTIRYYSDMTRMLRPIVLLLEIIIVIYLAHKKLQK